MSNISNLNIFQLLSLDNLSTEEKNGYLLRISKIAIQQAIERAIIDKVLDISIVEKIHQETNNPIEIQNRLIQNCPSLPEYVKNATDNLKIEILQRQIDETLKNSNNNDMTAAMELRSYLNLSLNELDENILLEKVNSFRTLQNNLLPTPK